MDPIGRYSAVLGRSPFTEREPLGAWNVRACGFPPLPRSFWRSLISEAHDTTVYVTAGMSEYIMPVPPAKQKLYPARIELMAMCAGQITAGPTDGEDVISALLLAIADYILDGQTYIGVGHTLDFQECLAPNTEMSAFFFTPPEGVDERRLCKCTNAKAILNVVPITSAEITLARQEGVEALIECLAASGAEPVFDFTRKSAV